MHASATSTLGLWRRVAPALLLVVLAPVIAEFLLADFTIRDLPVLLGVMPLYGGGALLVREVTRRTGRGWPTMIALALAYGLIEEAFLTQSLFNPNYVNQRLLDYGYLPALGTSLNWTLFVLSIHVVWSVATPILIAEGFAGARRTTPWLKKVGLGVVVALYLLGCASTAAFSLHASPFVASRAQFAVSALLVVATIGLAFLSFPPSRVARVPPGSVSAPSPAAVAGVMLVLAAAYLESEPLARAHAVGPAVPVVFRLACEGTALMLLWTWSRRPGWTSRHYLAIAAGTAVTYFGYGLAVILGGHTNLGASTNGVDVAGQVALGAAVFGLIWIGARRPRDADGGPARG